MTTIKVLNKMTIEELRVMRDEYLTRAKEAIHAPDPFGTNDGARLARFYKGIADDCLKQICRKMGIDPKDIGL